MSVQTEINRLQTAKADLKSILESKGMAVPGDASLNAYVDLTDQLGNGDMRKAVYDPGGKSRDIFAAVAANAALYRATFLLDGWSAAPEDAVANGYRYTQTAALAAEDPDAPAVTADSRFLPQMGTPKTGVAETDSILKEALNVLSGGVSTVGDGTVTALVQEKPAADLPVVWMLRTEV